jgi:hypothetical protein
MPQFDSRHRPGPNRPPAAPAPAAAEPALPAAPAPLPLAGLAVPAPSDGTPLAGSASTDADGRAALSALRRRAGSPAGDTADPAGLPIRRDVGFELETQDMLTKRGKAGALPRGGFPDAPTAQAAFNAPTAERLTKAEALMTGPVVGGKPDIELQADDGRLGSDLEVVLQHVPEDNAGRTRLDTALTDLDTLVARYQTLSATSAEIVPTEALDGTGHFANQMDDGMLLGPMHRAKTSPQVTMGLRAKNIPDIVMDLHGAPGESGAETTARDPGRRRMRRDDANNPTKPRDLQANDEAQTLINGHAMAQAAIAAYQVKEPTAPVGRDLEGFLTIVFTYSEGAQHKSSFLKNHTPLMAKTDLATIWETMAPNIQAHYGATNKLGKTNFEKLMETQPGYSKRMDRPLFDVPKGAAFAESVGTKKNKDQWWAKLTLRDWVRAVTIERQRTKGDAFREFFAGEQKRGVDQLRTSTFPGRPVDQEVEGYAAIGPNMDTDAATGQDLPVFELRSASKLMTFAEAHQWVLDMFDYVVSLNGNPNGGHQRIT